MFLARPGSQYAAGQTPRAYRDGLDRDPHCRKCRRLAAPGRGAAPWFVVRRIRHHSWHMVRAAPSRAGWTAQRATGPGIESHRGRKENVMTRLLVSVRSAAEARIALEFGAELIDVKEPARGSLGAPDPQVADEVVHEVAGRFSVSVALGELVSATGLPQALLRRVQYVKYGLAGCANRAEWTDCWRMAIERLPSSASPVAVAYADWRTAHAPDPL